MRGTGCNANIYAHRSGDWKLSWGSLGADTYIADLDYPKARCKALLPPTQSPPPAGAAGADAARADGAAEARLPWAHAGDEDLEDVGREKPAPVFDCPTKAWPPPFPTIRDSGPSLRLRL